MGAILAWIQILCLYEKNQKKRFIVNFRSMKSEYPGSSKSTKGK